MWLVVSTHEGDKYMLVIDGEVLARMDEIMHERGLGPAHVVSRHETREEAYAEMQRIAAERRERRRMERDERLLRRKMGGENGGR
jgi:hypothetical protein